MIAPTMNVMNPTLWGIPRVSINPIRTKLAFSPTAPHPPEFEECREGKPPAERSDAAIGEFAPEAGEDE